MASFIKVVFIRKISLADFYGYGIVFRSQTVNFRSGFQIGCISIPESIIRIVHMITNRKFDFSNLFAY